MSSGKVRAILHIGQHKTGSKALQSYLALNASKLMAHGILYPLSTSARHAIPAYRNSHFQCYALARYEAMAACGDKAAADQFRAQHRLYCKPFDVLHQALESFEKTRANAGLHTILLSAEDLFDMQSAHEVFFSEAWVKHAAQTFLDSAQKLGWAPEVVVYLRRPDHLLNAHYAQYIKGCSANTLDFESFSRDFSPRLDNRRILALWGSVFGKDSIHVRPYERASLPQGIVSDFFEHILGFLPDKAWAQVAPDLESSNITPDRACIDLMREINIRLGKGLPAPARDAVLNAALVEASATANAANWLSPAARYRLLTGYHQDYIEIAKSFGTPLQGEFFRESWPAASNDETMPQDYLNTERVLSLMLCSENEQKKSHRERLAAIAKIIFMLSVGTIAIAAAVLIFRLIK